MRPWLASLTFHQSVASFAATRPYAATAQIRDDPRQSLSSCHGRRLGMPAAQRTASDYGRESRSQQEQRGGFRVGRKRVSRFAVRRR